MRCDHTDPAHLHPQSHPRSGAVMLTFAVILTTLLGVLGLVIDGGFLLAAHRQTQSVADAAALAFAMDKLIGKTNAAALTTADNFVRVDNAVTTAVPLVLDTNVHTPPITGPHKGESLYVEVEVRVPVSTIFIHTGFTGDLMNQFHNLRSTEHFGIVLTLWTGQKEPLSYEIDVHVVAVRATVLDDVHDGPETATH